MKEIVMQGGWLMIPIIICAGLMIAIVAERFWSLRRKEIVPGKLASQVREWARSRKLDDAHITALEANSPLGSVLAAALRNRARSRDIIREAVEDTGRQVAHKLERYLNVLGTIAGMTPLMGLLGTVFGMIKVFNEIMQSGVGQANLMAGGISQALITTAAGLIVAIPSFFFYRYFRGRVNQLVIEMEAEVLHLIDAIDNAQPAAAKRTRASKSAPAK